MSEKHGDSPGAAAGVPQSDPPDKGEGIDPADVSPGFGGTSETKPKPEDDEGE
jgi:hypothetical protein